MNPSIIIGEIRRKTQQIRNGGATGNLTQPALDRLTADILALLAELGAEGRAPIPSPTFDNVVVLGCRGRMVRPADRPFGGDAA